MTKQEFINQVAERSGLGRRQAAEAVEAVLESITEALHNGEEVQFSGFGTFSARPSRSLGDAAVELRREADELASSQREFELRIESPRRKLRDIAAG